MQKGILERIGKGVFRLGKSSIFIPILANNTKILYNKLHAEFPFANYCIWNTSLLNEFIQHISNQLFTIIEVEKDTSNAVFLFLKENSSTIFLNPNLEMLEQYVFNTSNPIIIKDLISEAPLQKTKQYRTVTLEKILVDLFCDMDLFGFYQGREKNIIFKTAYQKYTINNTKLLRYASRRGKKKEVANYINQIIGKTI